MPPDMALWLTLGGSYYLCLQKKKKKKKKKKNPKDVRAIEVQLYIHGKTTFFLQARIGFMK